MAKYVFNELDQKILAGFKHFQETHSGLFCGVHEAYTQGVILMTLRKHTGKIN